MSVLLCGTTPEWESEPGYEAWTSRLDEVLNEVLKTVEFEGDAEANLLLSDAQTLQDLNREFRGKDVTTNVLSFPQFEKLEAKKNQKEPIFIGDMAMGYARIRSEASEFNLRFFDRATHMLVHSVLHLLGFDHIEETERLYMEELEKRILNKLGLSDPYEYGEDR